MKWNLSLVARFSSQNVQLSFIWAAGSSGCPTTVLRMVIYQDENTTPALKVFMCSPIISESQVDLIPTPHIPKGGFKNNVVLNRGWVSKVTSNCRMHRLPPLVDDVKWPMVDTLTDKWGYLPKVLQSGLGTVLSESWPCFRDRAFASSIWRLLQNTKGCFFEAVYFIYQNSFAFTHCHVPYKSCKATQELSAPNQTNNSHWNSSNAVSWRLKLWQI